MKNLLKSYSAFFVTLSVGILATFFLEFLGRPNDGTWQISESPKLAESALKWQERNSISVNVLEAIIQEVDPAYLTKNYSKIALFVTDSRSCPMIFNDATDYFEITHANDVLSLTIIADEGISKDRLMKIPFLNEWMTPIVLRPSTVSIGDVGTTMTNGGVLPELHIVDIATGDIQASVLLSFGALSLQKKRELLKLSEELLLRQ